MALCKYCKHYGFARKLLDPGKIPECSEVFIGFCDKRKGNFLIGDLTTADGNDCGEYERREYKYEKGTVFTNGVYCFGIQTIQPEYSPRCYRMSTPTGGRFSISEKELEKATLLWEPEK